MWGNDLLKNGVRWRVGCGSKVSVYIHKWLPRPMHWNLSPKVLNMDCKVVELVDYNDDWDEGLVRSCFMECEADLILSIPLGHVVYKDKCIWPR